MRARGREDAAAVIGMPDSNHGGAPPSLCRSEKPGHSLKNVEAFLHAHYIGGAIERAEHAIMKLDANYSHEVTN
jgi:hypothetical protein